MIHILSIFMKDKVSLILENGKTNLNKFLDSKGYYFYDTISAKGNLVSKNVYKHKDKYYVIGEIFKTTEGYIINLYDITTSIQNPENRL